MARIILTMMLVLAAALPGRAFALTLETPPANPDGTSKFVDPDKKWEPFDYRSLSNRDGDNNSSDNQPRGLTFGSPNSGAGSFTFGFGPVQNPNPFDNSRFFRTGP